MTGKNPARAAFSLLEMMVVLTIAALLSTLLIPSYREQLRSAHRAEAKVALQQLRYAMEEHYARHHSYQGAARGGDRGEPLWGAAAVPAQGNPVYRLHIEEAGAHSFLLAAIPVDSAVGRRQRCGRITLDHSGQWGGAEEYC